MQLMELYKALNISDNEYNEIVNRLGRVPNELEVYLFSAMWSEHCGYKHSRKYLSRLPKDGSICSEENAGGIPIGNQVVIFKVESHNHPSAIEPFQGAATGIGGIIRDVLAVGARPIALLDSLKFGKLNDHSTKHLFDGVIRGIAHYGNCIGVPTVAGEVGFDECYTTSPLVNVMAVGIVEKSKIKTSAAIPGNFIVLTGSHTGRDGIHGASFASKELSEESKEDRPSVQVGDPFMGKILIESTLEILEVPEVVACQDCGAAGLLSSTSEMAYKGECGVDIHLDAVHLRESVMQPWEIMLSESQERMVFIVEQAGLDKVLAITKKYDIPAAVIGRTTDTGMYRLFWNEKEVACLPPEILAEGPMYTLDETEPDYIQEYQCKKLNQKSSIPDAIIRVITDPNFAPKKWVYRQYDHTVGNRTSIKPGEAGSAGIWLNEEGGVIGLTIDSNGRQVFLDPYNGAKNTVWEAYRNLISSGFTPLGVTDCMNYGNPEKSEVAYQFVKSIDGISDACRESGIPVVSGNVSFYNECPDYRVYPTPTIGMVGYADTPSKLIRNSFINGETVVLIGKQINDSSDIGGSLYQRAQYDFLGGKVDCVDPELEKNLQEVIFNLRDQKLLGGCTDISELGIFGALFEGLKLGNTGFVGQLIDCNDPEKALFGEITGRYLISSSKIDEVRKILAESVIPYRELGICSGNKLEFDGYTFDNKELFKLYEEAIELEMNE
ncbi:MAG: phosphoribosylformylglycinamidine synthase II [Candidatus Melainabacteria bacterium GWF2_32_7]|nr:MAG: phosphoribosylformylglycinamidine synthase II [Candidatus Melainabacteria bacterium GWF2_32_7]